MDDDAGVVVEAIVLVRTVGAVAVVDPDAVPEEAAEEIAPHHRANVSLRGSAEVADGNRPLHEGVVLSLMRFSKVKGSRYCPTCTFSAGSAM